MERFFHLELNTPSHHLLQPKGWHTRGQARGPGDGSAAHDLRRGQLDPWVEEGSQGRNLKDQEQSSKGTLL